MFEDWISSNEDTENCDSHHKTHPPNDLPHDLSLHRSRHKRMVGFTLFPSYFDSLL